jgi:hypothetical protein
MNLKSEVVHLLPLAYGVAPPVLLDRRCFFKSTRRQLVTFTTIQRDQLSRSGAFAH